MHTEQAKPARHSNWIVILLLLEILYVLSEFAFNAALLNAAGGLVRDEDELHRIEEFGRLLSGVGLGILLYGLVFKKRIAETRITRGLTALTISLLICVPVMYFGQKILIDKYLVDKTDGEQRRSAETLIMMKATHHSDIFKISDLPLSSGDASKPGDLAFLSVMGALMINMPEYLSVLHAKEYEIRQSYIRITSAEHVEKIYSQYEKSHAALKDKYYMYRDASNKRLRSGHSKPLLAMLWERKMAGYGLAGIPPGLSFKAFAESQQVKSRMRRETGGSDLPYVNLGLSKEKLTEKIIGDNRLESFDQWKRTQEDRERHLANDGYAAEEGRGYVRALIIPPIALVLSLFFSLLTLAKLPLRIMKILRLRNYRVMRFFSPKVEGALLATIIATILILPARIGDTELMSSHVYAAIQRKTDDIAPVGGKSISWLVKGEPVVYSVGQMILEFGGMDNRDAKYRV